MNRQEVEQDRPLAAQTSKLRAVAWLGVLGGLVWLSVSALSFWPYTVDDAFISFRYARHALDGLGLVFNPGERVEGFSNLSWVLLSGLWMGLDLPVLVAAKWSGLGASLVAALGTLGLGRTLFAGTPGAGWKSGLGFALICLSAPFALWAVAGLETSLMAALAVCSVWAFERELRGARRLPLSALLLGLAWATRPEAPVLLLYFVVRRVTAGRPVGRADLAWAAMWLALVVPYEVFGLLYYGELLPATHAAKVEGRGLRLLTALGQGRFGNSLLAQVFTTQGLAWMALCLLAVPGALRRVRRLPCALWAPLVGGAVFLGYAFDDWMPALRLAIPSLPFLALLVAHGVTESALLLPQSGRSAGLGLATLLVAAFGVANYRVDLATPKAPPDTPLTRAADWPLGLGEAHTRSSFVQERNVWGLLEQVPAQEWIALGAIGLPGWTLDHPILDVRGLITPEAAEFRAASGDAQATQALLDRLWTCRPGLIVLPGVSKGAGAGLSSGRSMNRLLEAMQADARFAEGYRRVQRPWPRGALFERRDLGSVDVPARLEFALQRLPQFESPQIEQLRQRYGAR